MNANQNTAVAAVLKPSGIVIDGVRETITHNKPDFDAVVGILLLCRYGAEKFVGINKAPVRFAMNGILGNDADHDRNGVVPVDIGKGCRFSDKALRTRESGDCATTLVARYLNIHGRPELKRLLMETETSDNRTENTATNLPSLTKAMHRNGADQSMVFNYMKIMAEAVIGQEQYSYAPVACERPLIWWFDALVNEQGSVLLKDGGIFDRMVKDIRKSMELKDAKALELAHVVECLCRKGLGETDIKPLLRFVFGLMQADKVAFRKEVERIRPMRKNMITVLATVGNIRNMKLRLMVLDGTDNSQAHKAAMYRDREDGKNGGLAADLVIVRNTDGCVQFYTNKARTTGLDLSFLWKAIQWHELSFGQRQNTSVDNLGKTDESIVWYFFRHGGCIFNGSLTHKRDRTTIPLRVLVELVQYCLCKEGFDRLCDIHKMRSSKNTAQGGRGQDNGQNRGPKQGGQRDNRRDGGKRHLEPIPQAEKDRLAQLERELAATSAVKPSTPA